MVLEKPSSSFELATEKLKSLNKNISWTGGSKYLHCFRISVISFIIVENLGKVSAFVGAETMTFKGLKINGLRSLLSRSS